MTNPDDLQKVYENAAKNLAKRLEELPEANVGTRRYLKGLLNGINEELAVLSEFRAEWIETGISADYNGAIAMAYRDYRKANINLTISKANRDTLNAILDSANASLGATEKYIGRRLSDEIRKISLGVMAEKMTEGKTIREINKRLIEKLTENGILEIRDKNGRLLNMGAYAKMVARTTSTEAQNAGCMQQTKDIGEDLVKIPSNYTTCEICAIIQGRVYSISGRDKRFPPLSKAFPNGYKTVHPNCKHRVVPYVEDFDKDFDKTLEDSNRDFELLDSDLASIKRYQETQGKRIKAAKGADKKKIVAEESRTAVNDRMTNTAEKNISKFKEIYGDWDKRDRKELADNLLNEVGLKKLKAVVKDIDANGACDFFIDNDVANVTDFFLNVNDHRSDEHKIKTVFHELFHARFDGLKTDIKSINKSDFLDIEETFAESFSHYVAKAMGIELEMTPSYASTLTRTFPKLIQLDEFKDCENIVDIGEIVKEFRFGDNLKSEWADLSNRVASVDFDYVENSSKYLSYIEKNQENLLDVVLESMPDYSAYKPNMMVDIKNAINSLYDGKEPAKGNQSNMFDMVLITAMQRVGVL